jgi:tetratricopeptide (TPR) repeat protein
MESVFGLRAVELHAADPLPYLKFLALGVICGYLGSHLLDGIALTVDRRLVKFRTRLVKEEHVLQKAKVSSEALELAELATAYRVWKMYPDALILYDQAISLDPNNPHHYVQKSFVYSAQAKEPKNANLAADYCGDRVEHSGS